MRPMSALFAIKPLLERPFFTSKEAREKGVHPSTLAYYVKTGRLKRVQRGVYQRNGCKNSYLFRWKDLIKAVYTVKGGVVCLTSALAIYNLTEEMPRHYWIAIRHGSSPKRDCEFKFVRFRNMELGKTEIEVEGVNVPIFDRERTILDAFRLLSRETAIKALKMALSQREKIELIL